MTGQGGAEGASAVHGRSTDSGKSRLLVSEALAAPSPAAASSPSAPAATSGFPSPAALFRVAGAFTGDSLARQLRRTIVPLPPEFLSGVDAEGHTVDPDVDEVEKRMALYSLLIEYSFCPQYAPEGVYCMPSWDNLRIWHGVIIIRHGIYSGGVFKYKISIDGEYPRQAPTLVFLSRVYHVLVNPETGVLNLQVLFPQWKNEDYLPMLLMYLKSIFYRREFLEGTANESQWANLDAARAMQEDKKKVLEEVRQCVKESQQQLYSKTADVDFVFDFRPFHREHKPIFNALNVLAHDATCVDPTAAFVEWFLDDYCRSEFHDAAAPGASSQTAAARGEGGGEGQIPAARAPGREKGPEAKGEKAEDAGNEGEEARGKRESVEEKGNGKKAEEKKGGGEQGAREKGDKQETEEKDEEHDAQSKEDEKE